MKLSRLLLSIALTATLGLAGCGRKAPLDTPYAASIQAQEDARKAKQPAPPPVEKPVEDKRFILDGLID